MHFSYWKDVSQEDRQKITIGLKRFIEDFEKRFESAVYLIGGTLLGALREKDYIDHDDDIDLYYLSKYTTKKEVLKELNNIWNYYKEKGLDFYNRRWQYQLNLWFPDKFHWVDIYPSWIDSEGVQYLGGCNNKLYRCEILNMIKPLSKIMFRGIKFNAPNQSEKYLEWAFGGAVKQ